MSRLEDQREVAKARSAFDLSQITTDRLPELVSRALLAIYERRPDARRRVLDVARETVRLEGLADLVGRREVVERVGLTGGGAAPPPGAPPPVPPPAGASGMPSSAFFEKAAADIAGRHPVLADGWQDVARRYTEERAFAVARSTELALTERVQEVVAAAVRNGRPTAEVLADLGASDGWSQAYADTVYRTNVATANTAGKMAVAKDPAVRVLVGGWRYTTAYAPGTQGVRPNHGALDGIIAAVDDPVWRRIAPPNGYNCRCTIEPVFADEVPEAPPRVPDGWRPDPGFEVKPIA